MGTHGCAAALRGDRPAALRRPGEAVDSGFGTPRMIEADDDLKSLRDAPESRAIVARAAKNPG